jgi:multiple sugar transport system permease protein
MTVQTAATPGTAAAPRGRAPGRSGSPAAGAGDSSIGRPAGTDRRPTRRRTPVLAVVVLALGTAAAVVPLLYLVSVSLMSRNELVSGLVVSPDPRWSTWADVLADATVVRALVNSLVAAAGGAVLTLALSLPGAWAVVRSGTGGRLLAGTLTSPWLLPPIVAVIPLLALLRVLGLTNTLLGLTLVYGLANVPVAVWLLQPFLRRIPVEIDEAAQLDGAGPVRVLTGLVLPLAGPSLVAVGLIVGILNYSEFLLASFLTQDASSQTLPVALSLQLGERVADFGAIAASSVIGMLPVVVVAIAFSRRLVDGLTAGAVK